jgi:hypothetical protein
LKRILIIRAKERSTIPTRSLRSCARELFAQRSNRSPVVGAGLPGLILATGGSSGGDVDVNRPYLRAAASYEGAP